MSFRAQCRGNNVKAFESIQRAMRRDQSKTPEPMRSTLPNTDKPRIPHSEYQYASHSEFRIFLSAAPLLCWMARPHPHPLFGKNNERAARRKKSYGLSSSDERNDRNRTLEPSHGVRVCAFGEQAFLPGVELLK